MKAIVVEEVEGFQAAVGATAMSLIWEDRIVIDPKMRKYPYMRRRVLKHEFKHFRIVQKHGMTNRAGLYNFLLDGSYHLTFGLNFVIGALLDRRRDRRRK